MIEIPDSRMIRDLRIGDNVVVKVEDGKAVSIEKTKTTNKLKLIPLMLTAEFVMGIRANGSDFVRLSRMMANSFFQSPIIMIAYKP